MIRKCWKCRGYGTLASMGGMDTICTICKGIKYLDDTILEEAPKIATLNDITNLLTVKKELKKRYSNHKIKYLSRKQGRKYKKNNIDDSNVQTVTIQSGSNELVGL